MRAAILLALLAAPVRAQGVEDLGSPSFETRESAAAALVARGRDSVPALLAALEHSDLEVRRRAREILIDARLLVAATDLPDDVRRERTLRLVDRAATDPGSVREALLALGPEALDAIESLDPRLATRLGVALAVRGTRRSVRIDGELDRALDRFEGGDPSALLALGPDAAPAIEERLLLGEGGEASWLGQRALEFLFENEIRPAIRAGDRDLLDRTLDRAAAWMVLPGAGIVAREVRTLGEEAVSRLAERAGAISDPWIALRGLSPYGGTPAVDRKLGELLQRLIREDVNLIHLEQESRPHGVEVERLGMAWIDCADREPARAAEIVEAFGVPVGAEARVSSLAARLLGSETFDDRRPGYALLYHAPSLDRRPFVEAALADSAGAPKSVSFYVLDLLARCDDPRARTRLLELGEGGARVEVAAAIRGATDWHPARDFDRLSTRSQESYEAEWPLWRRWLEAHDAVERERIGTGDAAEWMKANALSEEREPQAYRGLVLRILRRSAFDPDFVRGLLAGEDPVLDPMELDAIVESGSAEAMAAVEEWLSSDATWPGRFAYPVINLSADHAERYLAAHHAAEFSEALVEELRDAFATEDDYRANVVLASWIVHFPALASPRLALEIPETKRDQALLAARLMIHSDDLRALPGMVEFASKFGLGLDGLLLLFTGHHGLGDRETALAWWEAHRAMTLEDVLAEALVLEGHPCETEAELVALVRRLRRIDRVTGAREDTSTSSTARRLYRLRTGRDVSVE